MDILKTDTPYNCYCGTGESDRFTSALIFDGRKRADPETVKIAIVSDRIVSGYYYNKFEEQFLARGVKPVLIPVECAGGQKGTTIPGDGKNLRLRQQTDTGVLQP